MKHTKTPWEILEVENSDTRIMAPSSSGVESDIAHIGKLEDAEFIVLAVNSHDELLEASKELYREFCAYVRCATEDDSMIAEIKLDRLKEAIWKAEGK